MTNLEQHFREIASKELPLYHAGNYVDRLDQLFEVGRINLSLAKLAEAHWDAVAIIAEAGKKHVKIYFFINIYYFCLFCFNE